MTNPPTGRRRAQRGPRTDSRARPPAVEPPNDRIMTLRALGRAAADVAVGFRNFATAQAAGAALTEAALTEAAAIIRVEVANGEWRVVDHGPARTATLEAPSRRIEHPRWGPTPEAITRARETLTRFLTPTQRDTYETRGYIDCVGSHGTRYRIHTDGSINGNVYWRDESGVEGGELCCAPANPNDRLPRDDLFFGQLALLMADEIRWLAEAVLDAGDYPPAYKALIPMGRCPCGCGDHD